MQFWEIDGEDLIVAKNITDMRAIFRDYHGETLRGHCCRRVLQDDAVTLVSTDGCATAEVTMRAGDLPHGRGYYPAAR